MPDPDDIEDLEPDNETVEANRSIEQGGGFGARELRSQRDPSRDNYSDIQPGSADEDPAETEVSREDVGGVQDMNP